MEDAHHRSDRTPNRNSNPSFAKKYLTKNYFLSPLHNPAQNERLRNEIEQKNEELRVRYKRQTGSTPYRGPLNKFSTKGSSHEEFSLSTISPSASSIMSTDAEDDFNRPPESSDEEENGLEDEQEGQKIQNLTAAQSKTNTVAKRKAEPDARLPRSKRRQRNPDAVADTSTNDTVAFNVLALPPDNFLDHFGSSQGTKGKRRAKTFTSSQRSKDSFSCPDPLSQKTPQKQSKHKDMVLFDDITKQSPMKTPQQFRTTTTPQSDHKATEEVGFRMPDSFDIGDDPEISQNEKDLLSNNSLNSPKQRLRKRRDSSSSLSSADSIAEYQLSKQEKEDLMAMGGTNLELDVRYQVRCPMCKRITERSGLGIYQDPSDFTLSKQQKFCYNHRIQDARKEWQRAAYPQIHWEKSLDIRIERQKKSLARVLRREEPSYYLDVLDCKMREAKGNQSQIKRYFDSGVLDVVHQGYYGPRGSKTFANAIANDESLRELFERQSRSDRAIRTAGFGRFVESVLLPEMILRLVMEDMATDDEVKAREILRDSTEIGILLHPGDDYVARTVEE